MRYRVLGHSRDNGQKMTIEVEAKSKADAEKQAERQNLNIIRAEPIGEGTEGEAEPQWKTIPARRRFKMPWLLIIFLVLIAAAYYCWPLISNAVHPLLPKATTAPSRGPTAG